MSLTPRFFFGLSLASFSGAAFAQPNCGDTLTTDTILTAPMTCPGPALIIATDDVELDCDGHPITGPGPLSTFGIQVVNASRVTIRNCDVLSYDVGLLLGAADHSLVVDSIFSENASAGIRLAGVAESNRIEGNLIHSNGTAGATVSGNENVLVGNEVYGNGQGLMLQAGSGNWFIANQVFENGTSGIYMSPFADHNLISENVVSNNGGSGLHAPYGSAYNDIFANEFIANWGYGISDTAGSQGNYVGNVCALNVLGPSDPLIWC